MASGVGFYLGEAAQPHGIGATLGLVTAQPHGIGAPTAMEQQQCRKEGQQPAAASSCLQQLA
eukprot:6449915-Karenia_brevis.AAC.1